MSSSPSVMECGQVHSCAGNHGFYEVTNSLAESCLEDSVL